MFLRHKIRRKDRKEHRAWSVVENRRVEGGRVAIGTKRASRARRDHASD